MNIELYCHSENGQVGSMENERRAKEISGRIREEIRIVGAIGELLQLFEGMGGPVKLEPDCLGVLGKLIVERVSGTFEALGELEGKG